MHSNSHAYFTFAIQGTSANLADVSFKLIWRRQHVRHGVGLVSGFIKVEEHCSLYATAANM